VPVFDDEPEALATVPSRFDPGYEIAIETSANSARS
jgi:hypothetical protein